jgi:hypothetical protein
LFKSEAAIAETLAGPLRAPARLGGGLAGMLSGASLSVKLVATASGRPPGHAHFKPSLISFVVASLHYLAGSDWLELRAFGNLAV